LFQRGRVEDVNLESQVLQRTMCLRIITPPGYEVHQIYPVLYFLHPWGLSPSYITDKLNIHKRLWAGIAQGALPPMVVVLPTGERSFYLNAADPPGHDWYNIVQGNEEFFGDALEQYGPYGDYLLGEVMPYVEEHYAVRADGAGRAISGISMGGAAAAVHAFRAPSRFCAVGIHSPALFTGPPENGGPPWIFGLDRESFAARNPADVARNLTPETQPRIYLDTGTQDLMRDVVEQLHHTFDDLGLNHFFSISPGGHNKAYWEPRMSEYLAFCARDWLDGTGCD
jgi:enterochelin esterase-like enzyme